MSQRLDAADYSIRNLDLSECIGSAVSTSRAASKVNRQVSRCIGRTGRVHCPSELTKV